MAAGWSSADFRNSVVDAVTLVAGLLAVGVLGWVTVDRLGSPPSPGQRIERDIEEWRSIAAPGSWMGPPDAAVVIVEFGDYECPFCQQLEPSLAAVRRAYPEELAVVYRHFPLPNHQHAYRAARMAECGRNQGYFEDVHRELYAAADLGYVTPQSILESVAIRDPDEFVKCAEATGAVDRIDRDLEAALAAGITGTPSLIVNGRLLATLPDSAWLSRRIDSILTVQRGGRARR